MIVSGRWALLAGPLLRLAVAAMAVAGIGSAAPVLARAPPEPSLAKLDEEFAAAVADLVRRCRQGGHEELAALIEGWPVPAAPGRQAAFAIPATIEQPACVASEESQSIWDDFLAARRARAASVFAQAVFAASRHDQPPTRASVHSPAADGVLLDQQSCEAIRLVYATLRDDPDHARARAAAGWVRRGDRWEWPAAARRLDQAAEYDPRFGWMPKGRLARYRDGERYAAGKWIRGTAPPVTDLRRAPQFESDHWEIVSTAEEHATADLAAALEATRLVWLQVFGGFALEPADLERRLGGRGRPTPQTQTPHSAILCGSRAEYLAELHRLEPQIEVSDGLYWQPTRTIWCYAAPELPPLTTVRHEATHQLFAESRPDILRMRSTPGERCGFWAVEAAAIYAESIEETSFGWLLGGRDRGRGPAARQLLVDHEFFVPLVELTALGREAFQSESQLDRLYDQCGGLADFFMNAHHGRYREAFVEYLVRVSSGTAQPDTLFRLCGRSGPALDAEYRDYLSPASEPSSAPPQPPDD